MHSQRHFTRSNPTLNLNPYSDHKLRRFTNVTEPSVPSPCVSICALDEEGVCLGCYRTGDEITDWFIADDERKREILRASDARRDRMNPMKLG